MNHHKKSFRDEIGDVCSCLYLCVQLVCLCVMGCCPNWKDSRSSYCIEGVCVCVCVCSAVCVCMYVCVQEKWRIFENIWTFVYYTQKVKVRYSIMCPQTLPTQFTIGNGFVTNLWNWKIYKYIGQYWNLKANMYFSI